MNDKALRVLEQYEITITGTRRGRGAYICDTDQGKKLLCDFTGSQKRLAFQNQVLSALQEQGFSNVDHIMENKEGLLASRDREENGYVLKDWFEGKECDTRSEQELILAVRNLARLHQHLQLSEEDREGNVSESLTEELERHNQELRKVRAFVRKCRQKNSFEAKFLHCFDQFYNQAEEAVEAVRKSAYEGLRQAALEEGRLCHGSYNQHQILLCKEGIATTNFDKCKYDVPLSDLYQFLRKILEKQNWNIELGMKLVEEYSRVLHISEDEMEYLCLRLTYPEKFWKLANRYYNMNKAWIPQKNVDKLDALSNQQAARLSFIKILH